MGSTLLQPVLAGILAVISMLIGAAALFTLKLRALIRVLQFVWEIVGGLFFLAAGFVDMLLQIASLLTGIGDSSFWENQGLSKMNQGLSMMFGSVPGLARDRGAMTLGSQAMFGEDLMNVMAPASAMGPAGAKSSTTINHYYMNEDADVLAGTLESSTGLVADILEGGN